MRRVRGRREAKTESRLDEHGTNSIGMEIEGKELCGQWGLFASMSSFYDILAGVSCMPWTG